MITISVSFVESPVFALSDRSTIVDVVVVVFHEIITRPVKQTDYKRSTVSLQ